MHKKISYFCIKLKTMSGKIESSEELIKETVESPQPEGHTKRHRDSSKKKLFSKQKSDRKSSFNLKEKFRQFREWQQRPYQPKPMTDEEHECANCHDHYKGNYCPRCGQSEKLGRYSFKVAMINFFDAVGLGDRGMFRTMLNLILRPSYLIRDYVGGMQASYFSPFKLYILLAAISVFVTHGVNIKGITHGKDKTAKTETTAKADSISVIKEDTTLLASTVEQVHEQQSLEADSRDSNEKRFITEEQKEELSTKISNFFDTLDSFEDKFPSIAALLIVLFISGCLYQFFRHSPNTPNLRYSEFFIALLYSVNMYSIYNIVFNFFCLSWLASLSYLLVLAPIKKFSGYSWWRTILKFIVAFLFTFFIIIFIYLLIAGIFFAFIKIFG